MPAACGSSSRMRAASIISSPGTPFAARRLRLARRDDDLAAQLVADAVLVAEAHQLLSAGDAVLRLQRAGRVVDAGVDDAAVVAALVRRQRLFLLDDADPQARVLLGQAH